MISIDTILKIYFDWIFSHKYVGTQKLEIIYAVQESNLVKVLEILVLKKSKTSFQSEHETDKKWTDILPGFK